MYIPSGQTIHALSCAYKQFTTPAFTFLSIHFLQCVIIESSARWKISKIASLHLFKVFTLLRTMIAGILWMLLLSACDPIRAVIQGPTLYKAISNLCRCLQSSPHEWQLLCYTSERPENPLVVRVSKTTTATVVQALANHLHRISKTHDQ